MELSFRASPLEPSFPSRVRAVEPLPDLFEAVGPLAPSIDRWTRVVAIVGTREPPEAAIAYTRWFARTLASAGALVISGGAFGVDAAAHEGALEAECATVAVLPGGVDVDAPPSHRELFDRIRRVGALVAIRPRGTTPRPPYYLQRNAVIAALADHVVLVAAPLQSGARSTAKAARILGRPLSVLVASPWDAATAGNGAELELGGATAINSPSAVLAALGLALPSIDQGFAHGFEQDDALRFAPRSRRAPSPRPKTGLAPRSAVAASTRVPMRAPPTPSVLPADEERSVMVALHEGATSIDELVLRTALPVASLRGLLLTWTVEGVVREGPAGVFRVING